jgi:hypothetical protein
MMMYKFNFKQTIKDFFVPKSELGKFVMFLVVVGLMGLGYWIIH